MNEPLRPLTLGEILDRTLQLYRRNFLLFAGSAAPPSAVIIAMFLAMGAVFGFFARSGAQGIASHGPAIVILGIGVLLVLLPLELGATVVSQAALMRAGISVNLGRKLKIREAIRGVWPRFWRYAWLLILQGVFIAVIPGAIAAVALGLVFLLAQLAGGGGFGTGLAAGIFTFVIIGAAFVAMVVLFLMVSLAMPICVAEDKPAWASMSRAIKLSKGTRGRMLLMLLLVWLLSLVVTALAYVPMMIVMVVVTAMAHGARYMGMILIVAEIVNVFINFAIQVFVTPVYALALVLFYFDQRIRTEGYDIEWMMEQAGLTRESAAGAQTAPVPAAGFPESGESGTLGTPSAGDAGAETG
jgi:hypothetical protein